MRRTGLIADILLGLVFLWAGVLKILDPGAFHSSILTYEVFSYSISAGAALLVPYLEICVGASLVFQVLKGGARMVACVLLGAFIALLVQAAIRGLVVDCGCFGSSQTSEDSGFAWPITRDVLVLLGLAIGFFCERISQKEKVV